MDMRYYHQCSKFIYETIIMLYKYFHYERAGLSEGMNYLWGIIHFSLKFLRLYNPLIKKSHVK